MTISPLLLRNQRTLITTLLTLGFPALAQAEQVKPTEQEPWQLSLGVQLIQTTEYSGSDDSKTWVLPTLEGYLALSESTVLFIAGYGVGINYQLSPSLSVGLLSNSRFERDSSESTDLAGLADIDGALELGPYVSYQITDNITIDLTGLFDVSNTHEGWVSDLTITGEFPVTNTALTLGFSSGLSYGSKEFNNTYYSVPLTGVNVGRPAFSAGKGLNQANAAFTASYLLSQQWTVKGSLAVTRLLGDAADSPLVKEQTQFIPSVGVSYEF